MLNKIKSIGEANVWSAILMPSSTGLKPLMQFSNVLVLYSS